MKAHQKLVAAAGATALLLIPGPTANAETAEQAHSLCDGASQCRIDVAQDALREGSPSRVSVVGNPNVRIEVVAYLVVTDADGSFAGLEQVATTGELFTSARGVAQAELGIAALESGSPGGLALVSTAGATDLDTSLAGSVVPFGTRFPAVLGDGFGADKPAGAALDLWHSGSIPGSRFSVEYLGEDGTWQDVSSAENPASGPADQITVTTYFIPQGLRPEPYLFRLLNQTAGIVVAEWEATPSTDGTPAERLPLVTPESLGVVSETHADEHPVSLVRTVSAAIAVAGLATVVVGIRLANRSVRRRHG